MKSPADHELEPGQLADAQGPAAAAVRRCGGTGRPPWRSCRACRRWWCPGRSRHCASAWRRAQRGEAFLLQGGDCAESFEGCESDRIAKQLKVLLQVSLVLLHGLKRPIMRVGRMAGQYAKPRSADTETRDGVTLPSATAATTSIARNSPPQRASPIRSCCCAATSAPR